MTSQPRYGLVGLGIMGRRMARRVASGSGGDVHVHNRTPLELGAEDAGLVAVETAAEVGRRSDVVFVMVSTPDAAREVILGDGGVLAGIAPGGTIVNSSTIGPDAAGEIGAAVEDAGVRYLDAPVLGSKVAAEKGELLFLVGGDEAVLARCADALGWLGRRTLHAGPVGRGSAAKLVYNALLGAGMAAVAEAITLAGALGFPPSFVLDQVLGSPVVPAAVQGKRPLLESGDFEAHFPLEWMLKDLDLALAAAGGADLPVTSAVRRRFADARDEGLGDLDFSAVARDAGRAR